MSEPRKDPFEGFTPTTPTEVALWNEIGRLKRAMWAINKFPPIDLCSLPPFDDIVCPTLPQTLTLPWGARVIGSIGPHGCLQVRMEARYGRDKEERFGVQYMVQPAYETKFIAADHAMQLHQRVLHQVAHFLATEEKVMQ